MITLAYLPTQEDIILPAKPSRQNMEEYGLAFEKAYENKGKRELQVDRYLSKTISKSKLKDKDISIDETTADFDARQSTKNSITMDYASYLYDLSVGNNDLVGEALESMEQAELLKEFLEESQHIYEQEGIWLYAVLEGLLKTVNDNKQNAKMKKQLLTIVDELNVMDLLQDVIRERLLGVLAEMHKGYDLPEVVLTTEEMYVEPLAI